MTIVEPHARVREVADRLRARAKEDCSRFVVLAEELAGGQLDDLGELQHLAHRMAGSAGLFGCSNLSIAARQLDDLLVAKSSDRALIQQHLDILVQTLHQVFSVA